MFTNRLRPSTRERSCLRVVINQTLVSSFVLDHPNMTVPLCLWIVFDHPHVTELWLIIVIYSPHKTALFKWIVFYSPHFSALFLWIVFYRPHVTVLFLLIVFYRPHVSALFLWIVFYRPHKTVLFLWIVFYRPSLDGFVNRSFSTVPIFVNNENISFLETIWRPWQLGYD